MGLAFGVVRPYAYFRFSVGDNMGSGTVVVDLDAYDMPLLCSMLLNLNYSHSAVLGIGL